MSEQPARHDGFGPSHTTPAVDVRNERLALVIRLIQLHQVDENSHTRTHQIGDPHSMIRGAGRARIRTGQESPWNNPIAGRGWRLDAWMGAILPFELARPFRPNPPTFHFIQPPIACN